MEPERVDRAVDRFSEASTTGGWCAGCQRSVLALSERGWCLRCDKRRRGIAPGAAVSCNTTPGYNAGVCGLCGKPTRSRRRAKYCSHDCRIKFYKSLRDRGHMRGTHDGRSPDGAG